MQPLPPPITSQVLFDAAASYAQAATRLQGPVGAELLTAAARSTFQGVPSLLMTSGRDSGSRELATQLRDAASAALELSKQLTAQPTNDFSGQRDVVLGWARLAELAAATVELPGSLLRG